MTANTKPSCCIDGCWTKSKAIKVKDIIYYLYPTDEQWADSWEQRIKQHDPNYKRKENAVICSLHFAKSDIYPHDRKLVDNAQLVHFPPRNKEYAKCCIVGCPTRFDELNMVKGYSFPDDEIQRTRWSTIISLYNNSCDFEWKKSMRICALHFHSNMIGPNDELLPNAKPSIFKDGVARRQLEIAEQHARKQERAKQQMNPSPSIQLKIQAQANQQKQQMRPSQLKQQSQPSIQAQQQAKMTTPRQQPQIKQQVHAVKVKQQVQTIQARQQLQTVQAKQQIHAVQANSNDPPQPLKIQSINVPLHKKKLDNQLVARRSAPIIARRLSLPMHKLPKLIPKPNIVKQLDQAQMIGKNGRNLLNRINKTNGGLSTAMANVTTVTKQPVQRPLPALNKVVNPTLNRVVNVLGKKISASNVAMLRKSMPPPLTLAGYTTQPATVTQKHSNIAAQVPTKSPIGRLIPVRSILKNNVKQVLRTQTNSALKTYGRDPKLIQLDSTMPIISRVQNGEQVYRMNATLPARNTPEMMDTEVVSSSTAMPIQLPDVIQISEEDPDIVMAINESLSPQFTTLAETTNDVTNQNGSEKLQYNEKDDEERFKYPLKLLERILANRSKNAELEIEVARLKEIYRKKKQQYRLKIATVSEETIEIS